jgi:hypothetical protein
MDVQGSAHWSAYTSAYQDLADLCLRGGLNAVIGVDEKLWGDVLYQSDRLLEEVMFMIFSEFSSHFSKDVSLKYICGSAGRHKMGFSQPASGWIDL